MSVPLPFPHFGGVRSGGVRASALALTPWYGRAFRADRKKPFTFREGLCSMPLSWKDAICLVMAGTSFGPVLALFSCHFAACRRFATARVRLGPRESLTGRGLSSHVLPEGRDAGGWPSCTVAWQQIAGVGASCTPHGGATHDSGLRVHLGAAVARGLGLRVHLTEGRRMTRALVYTSRGHAS